MVKIVYDFVIWYYVEIGDFSFFYKNNCKVQFLKKTLYLMLHIEFINFKCYVDLKWKYDFSKP